MQTRSEEVRHKLALIRHVLAQAGATCLYLRGSDWFSWATAGGSNTVLLTQETGVAGVVVTPDDALILTDRIEADRLAEEEAPEGFRLHATAWADPGAQAACVATLARGGTVLADRPAPGQQPLPEALWQARLVLTPPEVARYRQVGRLAAEAMSEVLRAARPHWSEQALAGAGAEALWARGLHPALTLAAGDRRLRQFRHPTPSAEPLGKQAMLVFCARGFGLYANLTRFVAWSILDAELVSQHEKIRQVEARLLDAVKPGTTLGELYLRLENAYREVGRPEAIAEHHQGGLTGYLARETLLLPHHALTFSPNMALAFNPSLRGSKVEDTFLLDPDGRLLNLTEDSAWPSVVVAGRPRPAVLEA